MTDGHEASGSPVQAVETGTLRLVHDVVDLAELQLQLFAADGRECARRIAPPLLAVVVGAVIALGSLPLILLGVSYALVELAGFPVWLAMLSASLAGVALGGALVVVGARHVQPQLAIWERSTGELRENVAWLKNTLQRPPASAGGQ